MPIFGPKCQFWAKFGSFWAQNPIIWGQGVKILVPSYRDSNETPFSCWKHWSVRLQLAASRKNVRFWPKNLELWGKKPIFCIVIAIFVNGAFHQYTRGYNFPIRTTLRKFRYQARGHFSGLTPVFGPFGPFPRQNMVNPKKWTLFFGPKISVFGQKSNLAIRPKFWLMTHL